MFCNQLKIYHQASFVRVGIFFFSTLFLHGYTDEIVTGLHFENEAWGEIIVLSTQKVKEQLVYNLLI